MHSYRQHALSLTLTAAVVIGGCGSSSEKRQPDPAGSLARARADVSLREFELEQARLRLHALERPQQSLRDTAQSFVELRNLRYETAGPAAVNDGRGTIEVLVQVTNTGTNEIERVPLGRVYQDQISGEVSMQDNTSMLQLRDEFENSFQTSTLVRAYADDERELAGLDSTDWERRISRSMDDRLHGVELLPGESCVLRAVFRGRVLPGSKELFLLLGNSGTAPPLKVSVQRHE